MKYCKDCKYKTQEYNCTKKYKGFLYDIDVMDVTCYRARTSECYCGVEGKYFEARVVEKLHIEVDKYDRLKILYKGYQIGEITNGGMLNILNNIPRVDLHTQWLKDDCPFDDSVVEWKGGKYQINALTMDIFLLRCDIEKGNIFDLTECSPCKNCTDPNIIRHKHNNRPVSF